MRARNELYLSVPLKFPVSAQAKSADTHVLAGRSRFVTEKMLKTVEQVAFQRASLGEAKLGDARSEGLDVAARLKEMW